MAKFTFKCETCDDEIQKNVFSLDSTFSCPKCNNPMRRLLPKLNGAPRVNELIDKHTGTVWQADQKEQVKLRQAEYYWTVEVPRFVASGVYSVETMLENSWITIDEKNQVHVNNVPPHRR